MATQGLCCPPVLESFGEPILIPPTSSCLWKQICAATVSSRACVPHAIDRHSVGRSCPACLYLSCIFCLQLLQSSPHLQIFWEQKRKTRKRGYSQRVFLWLLHLLTGILYGSCTKWASIAAPATTGEVNNSQLGQPDNLTIFSGTLHHSHMHTSPLRCVQNISCSAFTFSYLQHFILELCFSFLASCLSLPPESKAINKRNKSLQCSDHHRGFLACLQGCEGSRGFSGMAIETEETWKGGGKTMSTQAINHGIWLADFIIVVLKVSRILYWDF